ncbi:unnamed protein product [Allacma fusca]|uniref:Uncharacterized protein n=1 Tax=Allacma fusca TaxID=39272 RepID=A0A8J2KHN9_9HEXA|nr:unnamed protein product [Allacma fusca]
MLSALTYPFLLSLLFIWTLGESVQLESGKKDFADRSWILDWEPPEDIKNKFLYYVSGFDYDNKPVLIMEWGKWDFQGVAEKGGMEFDNATIILDQLIDRIQAGYFAKNDTDVFPPEKEIVVIVDFGGLKLRQIRSPPTFKLMLDRMAKMGTTYKCIAYGFIVNGKKSTYYNCVTLVSSLLG